jgi:hypothetical protein
MMCYLNYRPANDTDSAVSKVRRTQPKCPEAEFLVEIQTKVKVLRVFLLAVHSHLYSFAWRFLFIQTHATSYSFYISVTVQGERRKPYPLLYHLRKPYKNLKSENSQDYAQKPLQNCTFMNSASV